MDTQKLSVYDEVIFAFKKTKYINFQKQIHYFYWAQFGTKTCIIAL